MLFVNDRHRSLVAMVAAIGLLAIIGGHPAYAGKWALNPSVSWGTEMDRTWSMVTYPAQWISVPEPWNPNFGYWIGGGTSAQENLPVYSVTPDSNGGYSFSISSALDSAVTKQTVLINYNSSEPDAWADVTIFREYVWVPSGPGDLPPQWVTTTSTQDVTMSENCVMSPGYANYPTTFSSPWDNQSGLPHNFYNHTTETDVETNQIPDYDAIHDVYYIDVSGSAVGQVAMTASDMGVASWTASVTGRVTVGPPISQSGMVN
jgi:hypothetical protein